MTRFEVFATREDPQAQEGPFYFDAPSAEAACELYRRWAWDQNRGPSPLQPHGPLPDVEARALEGAP